MLAPAGLGSSEAGFTSHGTATAWYIFNLAHRQLGIFYRVCGAFVMC